MSSPGTTPRLFDRRAKEAREERDLAPWALRSATSRGRRAPEPEDELRTCWERDRDRVVHCTAFRRLMYKTQVFLNREGDHARTRLSHTLEVAQVGRSVGTALGLHETLCETIALAHDIGHPPFGHRGEGVLDDLMRGHGGFRHNSQVLRVVDELERRSPDYRGLNLTREVREALLKHERDEDLPEDLRPLPRQPSLEAQVIDLADSTAYNMHDIEDGLHAGMFSVEDLRDGVTLWRESEATVEHRHPGFLKDSPDDKLRIKRVANELLKSTINDLIESSTTRLTDADITTPAQVRTHPRRLIAHGDTLRPQVAELQSFLYARFYKHEHLRRFSTYARKVLTALFEALADSPTELPPWYRTWSDEIGPHRALCDYVAGMTDRFAEREYERLVGPLPELMPEGTGPRGRG